jgi:hypothetical protein
MRKSGKELASARKYEEVVKKPSVDGDYEQAQAFLKILLRGIKDFKEQSYVGIEFGKRWIISQDEMDAIKKVMYVLTDCIE